MAKTTERSTLGDPVDSMREYLRIVDACGLASDDVSMERIPAAAASKLSELEARLGARLFHRAPRRIELTDKGIQYLGDARARVGEATLPHSASWQARRETQGVVRLRAPIDFAVHQLTKHLPRFNALFPRIAIDVDTSVHAGRTKLGADLLIALRRHPPRGDHDVRGLALSRTVMCAAPDYLDRHGRPSHPRELADHALLLRPAAAGSSQTLSLRRDAADSDGGAGHVHRFDPGVRAALSSSNTHLSYAGALAGLGVCCLPSFVIEDALLESALERVLPQWSLPARTVWLCMPSSKAASSAVWLTHEYLLAMFGASDGDPWLNSENANG